MTELPSKHGFIENPASTKLSKIDQTPQTLALTLRQKAKGLLIVMGQVLRWVIDDRGHTGTGDFVGGSYPDEESEKD